MKFMSFGDMAPSCLVYRYPSTEYLADIVVGLEKEAAWWKIWYDGGKGRATSDRMGKDGVYKTCFGNSQARIEEEMR
jgi:hypothetical protein